MMIDAVFDCACRELAGLPLPFGERVGVRGDSPLDRPEPLTPPLSHPNSGLPEFGTLRWPKSDISDFGWEREPTESVAAQAANIASAATLRVGKAGREAFSFVPADIGARSGIFKRNGVEIGISSFGAMR